MPTLVGSKVDKYDMLDEVGHGGMAVVYRGRDTVLEREVAVKVLHPHLADREESRLRLRREALAVAKLRHDNILEIFDYSGPEADESYIVTEFIHGFTLKEWLDEHRNPRPAVAAMIIHRLAYALCHAHDAGIIHRDIKPENVMIRSKDGCLKLMDFGIAQIIDNQKLTVTGQLLGSPAYMAPELISGRPLDARTDLFSLGIMLYQLAAGTLPFSGRNPHEVLNRIADGAYPPPSTVCKLVDTELEEIIRKALSVNPDERFQTARSLAAELERYLKDVGLEPSDEEIGGYFTDPDTYGEDLDRRVCNELVDKAQVAARDGHTSRAIRLLGRVLDLDENHKAARLMLARVRRRERRVRQLLVGSAGLGGVGLLVAGVVLLAPQPNLAKLPEDKAPAPSVDTPVVTVPTRPASDVPKKTGASSTDDQKGDRSIAAKAVAQPRKRPRATANCEIKLTGNINESTLDNLKLVVDGVEKGKIGGRNIRIAFPTDKATIGVRIKGPRYAAGTRTVTRNECRAGPVGIAVTPRPGKLRLTGNAPEDVTIRCIEGCPKPIEKGRNYGKRSWPVITWGKNTVSYTVTLQFSHKDMDTTEKHVTLRPGDNLVHVEMKRREP